MELIARSVLADRLGMTRKAVQNLIDTGLVRDIVTSGRNVYVTAEEADRLESTPFVPEDHPVALMVKVAAAIKDPNDDERPWQGWNKDVDAQDPDQILGVGRWWQVRDPDRYVGNLLIPIAAGFVLAVYRVKGYRTGPGKLRAFDLEVASADEAKPFEGHRFPLQQGSFTDPR
ncbi:hypothetical protein HG717_21675 [Rhodococcus erythropolis]|uniref:hypothetical protein n=1 Tax=Rhodococcus TaxID=1827 RepID=UPI0015F70F08|nr:MULTISPECIES: hypothetical protein [Rhodococcus]MBY6386514.1 hypothetical protein [Rhodococcus erythropolis]